MIKWALQTLEIETMGGMMKCFFFNRQLCRMNVESAGLSKSIKHQTRQSELCLQLYLCRITSIQEPFLPFNSLMAKYVIIHIAGINKP